MLERTVAEIEAAQRDDGFIPHLPGKAGDPWDHVEAAMGLDVGGRHRSAERAYRWMASNQNLDGSWYGLYHANGVAERTRDANFCSYIAAGCWHHYLATDNVAFLDSIWPTIEAAIGFTLDLQAPDGTILWARDVAGSPWPSPLLTACSCIHLSLRCAVAIAETLGEERPDWELSVAQLADAIVARPDTFQPKDRFSMDWYYPVLGGVLTGEAAADRIAARWDEFVIEGRGVRCVSDRPWITSGESAEFVLALDAAGMRNEAETLFDWLQHLRAPSGGYWIGATHPDGTVWPREQPTWSSGAVLLAADALWGEGPTSGFFLGDSLPERFGYSEIVPDAL